MTSLPAGFDLVQEPLRVTVRPQGANPTGLPSGFVLDDPGAVTAGGLAKAGGIGLAKGAIGLAGMGGDAWSMIDAGLEKAGVSPEQREVAKQAITKLPGLGVAMGAPSSAKIQGKIEEFTGEFRKPQNKAERYMQTAAEFVPGALLPIGGGGAVARTIGQGIVPGLASEAGGEGGGGAAGGAF